MSAHMKRVHIVTPNTEIRQMFNQAGWTAVDKLQNADLILFPGGNDINPELYLQKKHTTTVFNLKRDDTDMEAYDYGSTKGRAMAGICRGAQFLHVMAGGFLYQHVNSHTDPHEAVFASLENTKTIVVSSTHHQMMADPFCGNVLMYAPGLATTKEYYENNSLKTLCTDHLDIEAMCYEDTNTFSYQPHPEFALRNKLYADCRDTFFNLLEKTLLF